MRWKVGDLCVAKTTQLGWANCEVRQLKEDVATVESLEYGEEEQINISEIKQFGPFVVNREGALIESAGCVDAGVYGGWKAGDACVAQWTQDGAWYNSQILHFFNENEILVRFMDYGNADFTTLGNLKPAGSPTGNVLSQSPKSPLPPPKHESTAEQLSPRSMKRVSFALEEKSPEEDKTRCWSVGDSCVAQWSEDGEWYRSKILEIQGEQVVFTDYGNEGVTTLEHLKPEDALEEREGWKVGDLCVAMWSEDEVWYNSQIIEINGERVLVKFLEYGNEDYTTLEQLKPPGSIEETLVEAKEDKWKVGDLCVAQWNQDQVWYDSQIVEIEGDKVLVRFVEYGNEDFTTLDQLKPAGSLVSQDGGEKTWSVGDLCVARWEEDLVWYDSKIIKIDGEKALVKFLDYGNEDFASLSELKPMGSLESEGSPPPSENQHGKMKDFNWKVDDFCVVKSVKFDQMYNGQILKIIADKALVYFIEFSENEELPLSALLPFGPYAINKEQKLVEFKDYEDVCVESINGWKNGDECVSRWAQDDCWYHSKILKIFSETEALVQFTKFGNADFAAISDLKPLDRSPEEIMAENEVNKIESSSEEVLAENEDKIEFKCEMSQPSQKEIIHTKKNTPDRDTKKNIESVQIKPFAVLNRDGNNKEDRDSDKETEAPGEKLTKTVTRSAPIRDCKGVGKRWKVGDLCVAKWREDGAWYNSKILGIDNNKVHVLFVEYGNQDYTLMEELKPPGSLDINGNLKEIDSGQFSDSEETDDHRTLEWKVGDVCKAQLNVDQSWFKCKILEINFGQALVEDYGSQQYYCSVHSIMPLGEVTVQEKKAGNEEVNSEEKVEAFRLEKIESKKQNKPKTTFPINPSVWNTVTSRTLTDSFNKRWNKLRPVNPLANDITAIYETKATWKVGDKAAAYWVSDGRWRHAIIQQLTGDEAFVICPDEDMVKGTQVNINSLKHKSVPTEALNLVDEEIKSIQKSQINHVKQESNSSLDRSTLDKPTSSHENKKPSDVKPEYNEEIDISTSTTSQSSPENSVNNGVLLTFSDLTEKSPKSDLKHSKPESYKPVLCDYKAGTSIEDYRGRLLSLAMTESGSKYLQSVIPGLTQREIHNLQTELMASGVSAMNHPKATFVVQKLVEVADARSMEMFVDSVAKHFSWVACHPAGSRVVQKCTLMSSPDLQSRIFTKIQDSRSLIMLAKNKYGTRVVQTCLPLMSVKIVKIIVDSLLGHIVNLGRHPFATYLIQQLVALETGQQAGTHLLVDEILQNIHLLAFDQFGTFLVQTLVSSTSPSSTLQLVSSWTVSNLPSLYVSQPAVYLAISVFRRLASLATNSPPAPGEDWSKLMAEFVASLTELEVEGRPLLITQAIHPQGHLLAREVVLQMANLPDVTFKNRVLHMLAKYTIVLKADSFGCVVLKALHGLL